MLAPAARGVTHAWRGIPRRFRIACHCHKLRMLGRRGIRSGLGGKPQATGTIHSQAVQGLA